MEKKKRIRHMFIHKKTVEALKKTHRKYRAHTEIITHEEVTWMLAGIMMGVLLTIGLHLLLLVVPAWLIIWYAWAKWHEKKHGLKNLFGEKYKNP